jgi:hypothetical protein
MIFDLLAKFIERNDPEWADDINSLHLLDFPYKSHEVLCSGMFSQEDLDDFTLPFSSVAIEDNTSCVILEDTEDRQVGCHKPRRFIDIIPVGQDPGNFETPDPDIPDSFRKEMSELGVHQITFGSLDSLSIPDKETNSSFRIASNIEYLVLCDKKGNTLEGFSGADVQASPVAQEAKSGIIKNIATAIEELLLVQQDTSLFILEKSPVKPRRIGKGRIARSQDRNRYVLLRPDAIRKQMQVKAPTGEGSSKKPHERRRHWRTLKSERYTNKRGQKILIDAVWVGPKESVVGKTRYRVRLDV